MDTCIFSSLWFPGSIDHNCNTIFIFILIYIRVILHHNTAYRHTFHLFIQRMIKTFAYAKCNIHNILFIKTLSIRNWKDCMLESRNNPLSTFHNVRHSQTWMVFAVSKMQNVEYYVLYPVKLLGKGKGKVNLYFQD